jgi:Flp pilus assembly secretin CpaC
MKRAYKVLLVASLTVATSTFLQAQVNVVPMSQPNKEVSVTQIGGKQEQEKPAAAPATAQPAAAPAAAKAVDVQEPEQVVKKELNEEHFLPIRGVQRITVSNPQVITAIVFPDGSGINVSMKGQGTSDLRVFLPDGSVRFIRFVVSSQDVEKDLQSLRQLLSDVVGVTATRVGDMLVTQGTIVSVTDYQKYKTIIEKFNVIDLVESQITQSEQQKMLAQLRQDFDSRNFGQIAASLKKDSTGELNIWLTGVATTDREKAEAEEIAKLYFPKVMSHIQLQKPMIEMDVVIVTVDMSKADKRGDNLYSALNTIDFQLLREVEQADPKTGIISEFYTAQPVQQLNGHGDDAAREYLFNYPGAAGGRAGSGLDFGTDNAGSSGDELLMTWDPGGNALAQIEANKTQGYVIGYNAPHVSVLSGESASFKDGLSTFVGLTGSESVGVTEIEQGTTITVVPSVLENGKIRIQVTTSTKSGTTNQTGLSGGGGGNIQEIITLKDVNTSSSVEVNDGQTIIIAGTNGNVFSTSKDEFPLFSKIPVINLFFKESGRQGTNVRSFVFLTPTSPNVFTEANRRRHSENADKARKYYEQDSQYRKGSVGYYLGWEKDIPAPPEVTPAPEDSFGNQ